MFLFRVILLLKLTICREKIMRMKSNNKTEIMQDFSCNFLTLICREFELYIYIYIYK